MYLIFTLVVLLTGTLSVHGREPWARLFTNRANCTGERVELQNSMPDLREYGWDPYNDKIPVSLEGVYVLYEHLKFNEARDCVVGLMWSVPPPGMEDPPACMVYGSVTWNSARVVGFSEDYDTPSITFYETRNWQDLEEVATEDIAELTIPTLPYTALASFVLIGNSDWTVYTGVNYSGDAYCVAANEAPYYLPVLLRDINVDLGILPGETIRSVRKGCHSPMRSVITPLINTPTGFMVLK